MDKMPQQSDMLKEDAKAVLDDLKAKLEAFQAREDELRNTLKALGFEWLLKVPKSSLDTSAAPKEGAREAPSTPATSEEGAEDAPHVTGAAGAKWGDPRI
ncbi:hypothetical protein MAPG_03112 [Magnaporthiopsis poae ATCC 64411]|uniref:Uncharacterized protein n=1 Tax=Magnaporthiopsis poae (strain ATCC 64411 / 73-15) TaxID=644358 RepID=A0A0C4DT55_MAGP6|nr:hypothetical protein MAPG_03112 [Magnaporthiopsis poae ATCC 64411]